MIENSLWLLASVKILELAIIISAAIRILKRINVVDIVSWDENEEMNELIEWRYIILNAESKVRINNVAIVIHQ